MKGKEGEGSGFTFTSWVNDTKEQILSSPLTDKDSEAQIGDVSCPKSQTW